MQPPAQPELPVDAERLVPFMGCLYASYARLLGQPLLVEAPQLDGPALLRALFDAPFPLLAHDAQPDPVFLFGNRAALTLWEYDFAEFTTLPSRLSAEPGLRAEREHFLEQVRMHGYVADYHGVRISRSGRRFRILEATVWNVTNGAGQRLGQAACFTHWVPV